MTDVIADAARRYVGLGFETLRTVVDGLPAEALNWEPAGEETNSIAVLTTHAAHATRLLLHMAAGIGLPPRDRQAEFAATAEGPGPLLALIDEIDAECEAVLDGAAGSDWTALRTRTRSDGTTVEVPAIDALFHAVEHLRGHADEASLTRHLWMARA
jgi:hypothetical protein